MLAVRLIAVGEVKATHIREGCDVYLKRLKPMARMESDIIRAGKPEEERKRILDRLEKSDDIVIVLDETGTSFTSQKFASLLQTHEQAGDHLTFVIGGAYGLSDEIRKRADIVLSLSDMTLPHELAQLLFLEQLYRACMINRGAEYHH